MIYKPSDIVSQFWSVGLRSTVSVIGRCHLEL